jgi:succinyl-CoA synthetase alpha subunit
MPRKTAEFIKTMSKPVVGFIAAAARRDGRAWGAIISRAAPLLLKLQH